MVFISPQAYIGPNRAGMLLYVNELAGAGYKLKTLRREGFVYVVQKINICSALACKALLLVYPGKQPVRR
jgi:hypothetical protein